MTADSWSEVERVLGDALDCAPADRDTFVLRACAGRPELAAEVRALLAEHDRGGPLDALDALDASGRQTDAEPSLAGRLAGPYRLVREIGRGAMGSIWLRLSGCRTSRSATSSPI